MDIEIPLTIGTLLFTDYLCHSYRIIEKWVTVLIITYQTYAIPQHLVSWKVSTQAIDSVQICNPTEENV